MVLQCVASARTCDAAEGWIAHPAVGLSRNKNPSSLFPSYQPLQLTMRGVLKLRGYFIRLRVTVHVASFHFRDSSRLRKRVDIGRGNVTLCMHPDFKRSVWVAVRVIRVRDPILSKSNHLA